MSEVKKKLQESLLKLMRLKYGLPEPSPVQPPEKIYKPHQIRRRNSLILIDQMKKAQPETINLLLENAIAKGIIKKESPTILAKKYFKKYIQPQQMEMRRNQQNSQFKSEQQSQERFQQHSFSFEMKAFEQTQDGRISKMNRNEKLNKSVGAFKTYKFKRTLKNFEELGMNLRRQSKKNSEIIEPLELVDQSKALFREVSRLPNFNPQSHKALQIEITQPKYEDLNLQSNLNASPFSNKLGKYISQSPNRLKKVEFFQAPLETFALRKFSQPAEVDHYKIPEKTRQKNGYHTQNTSPQSVIQSQITKISSGLNVVYKSNIKSAIANDSSNQMSNLALGSKEFIVKFQISPEAQDTMSIQLPKFQQLIQKGNHMSDTIETMFRKMQSTSGEVSIAGIQNHQTVLKNLRISKVQIKQHVIKRYKKLVGEKILSALFKSNPNNHIFDIYQYLGLIDSMVNPIEIQELTFNVFDISSNGCICEHDVFQLMSIFNQEQNKIFMNAFSDDLCSVTRILEGKIKMNSYAEEQMMLPNILKNAAIPTSVKQKIKIDKLSKVINLLKSQGSSPKPQADQSAKPSQGRVDSLHSQFHTNRCESISKIEFQMQVQLPYNGLSGIADDVVHHLTGISLKNYIEQEKKKIKAALGIKEVNMQRQLLAVSLKQIKSQFQRADFESIQITFYKLSLRKATSLFGEEKPDVVFISEESFVRNFASVFILDNATLAKRLYNVLTNFQPQQRIYLEQFFDKMYQLINGGNDSKNRFAFQIYDSKNRGFINSIDLEEFLIKILPCQSNLEKFKLCECPLRKEVKLLSEEYVQSNIINWTSKTKVVINFDYFKSQVGLSCLHQELVDRILQKPKSESLFMNYSHRDFKTKDDQIADFGLPAAGGGSQAQLDDSMLLRKSPNTNKL